MKTRLWLFLAVSLATSAVAQEITPVWLQHLNGSVSVLPENKLPILVKAGGTGANTYNFDGTDVLDSYPTFLRYDDDHYLLGIRENGINENDPALSAELQAHAAAFPDRSIIWIDAKTGQPLGLALKTEVVPVQLAAQAPSYAWWKFGISDGTHGERVIYTGFRYKILRYAATGVVNDPAFPAGRATWSTTPSEVWVEPVPDEPNPSFPPYINQNDPAQVADWVDSSGGDGSDSWRWKAFRVSGAGNNTKIWAGGGTWRASMNAQEFITDDGGLSFYPIARLNDRGDGCGAKGNYSLGGQPGNIRTTAEGLEWCIQSHFPGTGWEARPGRYVRNTNGSNPCTDTPWWLCRTCSLGNSKTNEPTRANYFDPVEGAVGSLPAFNWEAAGKDGVPLDHKVDGVERYDGNWVLTADSKEGVDYIVTYSIPSWNQQFGNVGDTNATFKPGWVGLHTLDGKIATGDSQGQNYAYKIPVYETDEPIEDPDGNNGTGHDYGYDGDLTVYPDADGIGGAMVLWAGGSYGFGVFRVENVPAAITQQPQGGSRTEGESITLSALVSGGANLFQWLKDGQPIPLATSQTLTFDRLQLTDSGSYKLRVLNRLGNVDSSDAVVVVVPDTVPPTLATVVAANNSSLTASWVTIVFSERVTAATAGDRSNYGLSGGASVQDVVVVDDWTVMLQTSSLAPGAEFMLTVNGVRDHAPTPNTIVANTQHQFTIALTPGAVLWEFYPDIPGGSVDDLIFDGNYPDNPARRELLSDFTTIPKLGSNLAETFGGRVSGWITPKESGDYTFFIRSDDASRLLLSADENEGNAVPIAEETGCCQAFLEPGEAAQTSLPQALVAGRRYFIAALYKENGGGDYVEVAWRKEGDSTPASQLQPIRGEYLSVYRSVPKEEPKFNLPVLSAGQITLTWTGTATLQQSNDLKTWTSVAGNPASGYQVNPAQGQQTFYRLVQ